MRKLCMKILPMITQDRAELQMKRRPHERAELQLVAWNVSYFRPLPKATHISAIQITGQKVMTLESIMTKGGGGTIPFFSEICTFFLDLS